MSQILPHLHVVLLCEDYGERLWPIAREQAPACFAAVEPNSTDTMLTAALRRGRPFTEHPMHIVTTEQLAPAINDMLLSQGNMREGDFELLVQPMRRGSATSIALATARIRYNDPQAVILIMRSDQRMTLDDRWERTLFRAYQIALQDRIVLFGGEQAEKCADYSYIRRGKPYDQVEGAYEVRLFSADQPAGTARRVCDQGAYWHSGMILARGAVLLGELATVGELGRTPETQSSHRIAETANFLALLDPVEWMRPEARRVIEVLPTVSYEKAALECSSRLVVVPTTIEFSAVSNLEDLDFMEPATREGNRCIGKGTLAVNCRNTTLYTQEGGRQIVALGLRDAFVVDTPDALLVTTKDKLRDSGDLFVTMREAGTEQLRCAARRPFSWGSATLLENTETHATWRIELRPGTSMNTLTVPFAFEVFDQTNFKEQYVVLEGKVNVTRGSGPGPSDDHAAGDCFGAEVPHPHRVVSLGGEQAIMLLTAVLR